jgi:hypothetical protein
MNTQALTARLRKQAIELEQLRRSNEQLQAECKGRGYEIERLKIELDVATGRLKITE